MGLHQIVTSKAYKKFMSMLYGVGASIVITGALFKILHLKFADIMLIFGMGTEAIIFFFSAFEPPHIEVDWSIVYPELSGDDPNANNIARMGKSLQQQYANEEADRLLSEKLDKMLQAARVDVSLFSSLNSNINRLSEVASNMSTTADVVSVNANYSREVSRLTETLGRLNSMYVEQLAVSTKQMEIQQLSNEKQLANQQEVAARLLDAQQEASRKQLELQSELSRKQMEDANKTQYAMTQIAEALHQSIHDSAAYKQEVAELSEKVKSLNALYANMLTALSSINK
jgi:gliding motility-associated protein GldL